MSRKTAGNWVDRGESPNPTLRRVLAHFFERFDPADEPWLEEHALNLLGMVGADASEIQIAGYLRGVAREIGYPAGEPLGARETAISLWHIAKAALVRDLAKREARGEVSVDVQTPDSLSHWLKERLLSPEELEALENEEG